MAECKEIVELTRWKSSVNGRLDDHEERLAQHRESIARLTASEQKLMRLVEDSATRSDILELKGHIMGHVDQSVNGVLRDALNATPAHVANTISKSTKMWIAFGAICGSLAAIAALGSLIISVAHP